jgi:RNA polymerase sigma factor (sigma-70 family)
MSGRQTNAVIEHIRQLAEGGRANPATDQEPLSRFIERKDEAAFAALVRRHGPMILALCRRVLHHAQDAEDVFQATFLVLARKAAGIRKLESVGSWLYGVAYRLALKAKTEAAKRQARNPVSSRNRGSLVDPLAEITWREVCTALDEELARLPDPCRSPLVLCYLQGKTQDEALQQLGWSKSTFRRRLEEGRTKLCSRLTRRGITLSAGLWATLLSDQLRALTQPGSPAAALMQSTVQNAISFAAGEAASAAISPNVTLLAKEALKAAFIHKIKWAAMVGIAMAFTTGLGLAAHHAFTAKQSTDHPKELFAWADEQRNQPKPEKAKQPRLDLYGDPLPHGAIHRLGSVRFRAPDEIGSVTFAPDGKTIAVHSMAGIIIFDSTSGKRLMRLPGSGSAWYMENSIAFSPDGTRIACRATVMIGNRGKWVVRVMELAGEPQSRDYDADHLMWLGWSRDGELLAVCLEQGGLRLHELISGRSQRFESEGLPKPELSETIKCACAPDGRILAIVDWNKTIHVWDTGTGMKRWSGQPESDYVGCLAIAPEGKTLATLNRNRASPESDAVELWDAMSGKSLRIVAAGQKYMSTIQFSPDGRTLVTAGSYGLHFWDTATGGERSHSEAIDTERIAFSSDAKTLVAAERHSAAFHLWDVATGKRKPEPVSHAGRPRGLSLSPDGRRLATSGGVDGTIHIWDLSTGESRFAIHRNPWTAGDIAFSKDGKSLFSTGPDQNLLVTDPTTGKQKHDIRVENPDRPDHYQSAISMHLSDDGKTLVALTQYRPKKPGAGQNSSEEALVIGWDASSRKQLFRRRLPSQDSWIALSSDARVIAMLYPPVDLRAHEMAMLRGEAVKRTIRLEDVETGEPLLTFPPPEWQNWPIAFSPDGRLLASNDFSSKRIKPDDPSSTGSILRVWEVTTASEVLSLPAATQHYAALSHDGRLLAMTAPLQEIMVWDLGAGRELCRFRGLHAEVTALKFSLDGRKLISGLADSTLLIWEIGPHEIPHSAKLGPESFIKAWADLAGNDASRAFKARWTLASATEEAVSFFKGRLRPAQPADPERLRQLIADLDSKPFDQREKAQKELHELEELAASALRQALAAKPSLEVRRRIEALLDGLCKPITRPEKLQALRALAVLEDIGTHEAQEVLKKLTTGDPEARLTQEAKASLERLARRSSVSP